MNAQRKKARKTTPAPETLEQRVERAIQEKVEGVLRHGGIVSISGPPEVTGGNVYVSPALIRQRVTEKLLEIGRKCVVKGKEGGSAERITLDERRERIAKAEKAIVEYKSKYGEDCKVDMMWARISVPLGFSKKTYKRDLEAVRKADGKSEDNPR